MLSSLVLKYLPSTVIDSRMQTYFYVCWMQHFNLCTYFTSQAAYSSKACALKVRFAGAFDCRFPVYPRRWVRKTGSTTQVLPTRHHPTPKRKGYVRLSTLAGRMLIITYIQAMQ